MAEEYLTHFVNLDDEDDPVTLDDDELEEDDKDDADADADDKDDKDDLLDPDPIEEDI